jgi:RNA polymerase sigma-70 factor (ECF subfamily)
VKKGGEALDYEAIQPLLEEKMKMIYKYLVKMGANRNDAEDIVQETVYKFFLYIESIDAEKASSWLFRVAVNHYYDLCRKQKRRGTVSIENFSFQDDSLLPEEYLGKTELKEEIHHVLDQLNPTYKQLLFLKYELELTYEEMADMLDLKLPTLKTYLFRAREKFKEIYRRDMNHDGC